MTSKGHKVAIVEQTETTRQCTARNLQEKSSLTAEKMQDLSMEDKLTQKSSLVSNRQIRSIYSKGTYNNV